MVENNAYVGTSSRAIVFFNETQWPNGLYASDIIIRKNRIEDSGFDGNTPPAPVAMNFVGQHGPAKSLGPRLILIEENTFRNAPSPEIMLVSTRDVMVRHNQVESRSGKCVPARVDQKNTEAVSID